MEDQHLTDLPPNGGPPSSMVNGAIFQKIGRIFQVNIGAAKGIVGAAGGIGGYFLA